MPSSTEWMASASFLTFTLLQIPFFIARTDLTPTGLITLSPLQVTVANLARVYPAFTPYADAALLPGTWVSWALLPYVKCLHERGLGKRLCAAAARDLTDVDRLRKRANLPRLISVVGADHFGARPAVTYGSSMVVLSALASVVCSVRTGIIGFALLGWGIYQGDHDPMPPLILCGFLVVYAGLKLGEPTGGGGSARGAARRQQQQQQGVGSASAAGQSKRTAAAARGSKKKA